MAEGWDRTLQRLKRLMADSHLSMSAHARALDLSPAALSRILNQQTADPHPSTQQRIREYVQRADETNELSGADLEAGAVAYATDGGTPEEELLEYFMRNYEQMGTFLSTTTDGLTAEDRRMVAVAIMNGFKKLAIAAGERIPPEFFEIERRFVSE